ncbi:acyl-CoA dehydrogenase [Novosphingopyxis sp.]|uniref:acyl-CoA dehydrogenase n=1 Tax=Novosphingopyxis sp. TaxID=2709690 RepID=UPI003B5ABAFF
MKSVAGYLRNLFAQGKFSDELATAFDDAFDERLYLFSDACVVVHCISTMVEAGAADLAFGRLFEGHVNALQLIERYGTSAQQNVVRQLVSDGARFGVWNSDLPGDPLSVNGDKLSGGKNFASGAGFLSHAIVTTDANDPILCQMHLVDLDTGNGPDVDRSWWMPLGMARTDSHVVRWDRRHPPVSERIGELGDYQRQPFFSAGALRFIAVQAGGICQLYECLRDHLVSSGRAEHPQQQRRLSEAFADAQCAIDMVIAAASRYDESLPDLVVNISAVRLKVLELAEAQLTRVQRAVGVSAMLPGHPVYRPLTDLMTYLRQPNPDGASASVGAAMPDLTL